MARRRFTAPAPAPAPASMKMASVLLLSLYAALAMAELLTSDDDNMSSAAAARLFWSSAKEEADLLRTAEDDSPSAAVVGDRDHDDIDGGFSTLDGMLQWSIGHSDPAKLKEAAEDIRRLSSAELEKRQMEIKELMEKLKMPSDAQLMQIAIDDLNNSSLSLEDRHRALQELLILVEPIDNANDLHKLGGIAAVIHELSHPNSDIRRISAWILGKASQNNPVVQKQFLELGALTKLMKMVRSSSVEEAIKAFYAVSALIRNNMDGQELFFAEAGDLMLQEILSNSSIDIRLCRKAVFLVADLAECQLEDMHKAALPFLSNQFLLKSVVDLTASTDLDLQEKALVAVKSLLQLRSNEALVFKDFCGLESALARMREQFQDLMLEEYRRDYAMDLEKLRSEVELIYRRKLQKDGGVPT
ncbi:hsp70 nucleotide exchange factor FES1 isoform X2 [Malania oleifera]|uniref:hsp70 nucleotide exchange factor FES1 isoform X2 n=1 Tax=Malania oleifera TaxID=397392 RepID=UPI0025ADCDE4|nr:hsp70 nucleotide exchange factor FES1 isoform X2 [Malania oleifera]